MARIFEILMGSLTAGSVLAILCMPATAAGISVGGVGGVSVGSGGASANVGGNSGATASVSLGGSGANAAASVGDTGGATASIGTGSANVGVVTGVGTDVNVGVGTNPAANPSNPTASSNPNLASVVGDMSNAQVTRMKKRCVEVLSNEDTYDRDLRRFCLLISRR
ncbi:MULTISPECIES: hypothetical protein [unclassified Mesorhizobium]|uniref:hypothetical protein n=2 Tax=unclassified Mesorhizobium TaxID=325217 RepID=UPI0004CE7A6D|nr:MULTISPECIES: hypothetical protein [unclassified Mesorhizobium]WJI55962.1 hypothetical protein NLY33_22570 [Mesorhizobium sp. C432A]